MIDSHRQLIEMLADGRFHSGEALAGVLGVSRAAVWKRLRAAAEHLDLDIQSVRGRGHRLARPLELLERQALESWIAPERRSSLEAVEIFDSLASTSRYLSEGAGTWGSGGRVCLAEHQTGGRGRRGRSWVSPYGANLYLSLYWRFDLPMAALSGLSLGAGVAAARALERAGLVGTSLKWPNDIHHREKKLGGILVEVLGQPEGPVSAIIGVGINVDMPGRSGSTIDQDWTDLRGALGEDLSGIRNRVAGLVIDELLAMVAVLAGGGWPELRHAWTGFDPYIGREVEVHTPGGIERGVYLGVDDDGALLLETGGVARTYHAGEVSLRATGGGPR